MATYREKYGAKIAQGVQQQAAKAVQTVTTQPVKESAPKVAKNVVTGMGALATGLAMAATNPGGALKAGATALKQLSASAPKQTQSFGAAGSSPYSGMSDADLSAKAAANSQAWHTSDAATRKQLEDANVAIRAELDRRQGTVSTRDGNGVWTKVAAPGAASGGKGISLAGGSAQSGIPDRGFALTGAPTAGSGLDDNGQVDWSKMIQQGIADRAAASDIQGYLDQRNAKIDAAGGALDQYRDDAVSQMAKAYIAATSVPQQTQQEPIQQVTQPVQTQPQTQQRQPEYPVQYTNFQDLYNKGGYQQAQALQEKLLAAQLAQVENAYNSQRSGINQSAQEQARQAYINYMQAQASMPQALAASGYTGGMADSQKLDLALGYQNAQQQILQDRDQALNNMTTALNDARLQTSIQGVQAQGELMQQAAAAYQAWVAQQNAYANQDFWTQYGYDQQARQQEQSYQQQLGLLGAQSQYDLQAQMIASALAAQQQAQSYQQQLGLMGVQHQYDQQDQAQAAQKEIAQYLASKGVYSGLGATYGLSQADLEALAAYDQRQKLEENLAQSGQVSASMGDYTDLGTLWGKSPEWIAQMNQGYAAQQAQAAQSAAWDRLLEAWKAGSPELYAAAGGDGTDLQRLFDAQIQAALKKGSSGSNNGGNLTDPYSALAAAGVTDEGAAYGMLLAKGYNSTEAMNLAKFYMDNLKDDPLDPPEEPLTEEALAAMIRSGQYYAQRGNDSAVQALVRANYQAMTEDQLKRFNDALGIKS